MSQLALQERAEAANATYNAAASTTWLTPGNWSPAAYPGATGSSANTDIASFANVPSGSLTLGINMNTAGGNFSVGAISNSPARTAALNIGNNAGTAAGTLRLNGATVNGVANVILRNAGSAAVTIQAKQGSGLAMGLALGNNTDNRIYVDSSSDITIQSIITSVSGTTPLTIAGSGSGIAHITNTANTFTGTITFLGAETRFNGPGSFGNVNNTLVIDGGRMATLSGSTYTLASTHGIQVSDAAGNSISVVTSGTLTYDGVMADKPSTAGAWAKQGAGTLALGGASTYTGDTAINNGTLQLTTGHDRLPTGTTLRFGQAASANLGTLDLNGRNQQVAGLVSTAGNNASTVKNLIKSASAATLTLGGSGDHVFSAATAANSGVITGAITLVKSGSGTQTFGEANFYTGKTTINGGAIAGNGESIFGTNPVSFVADQITLNGGGIKRSGGNIAFSSNRGITLGAGGGTFDASGGTITLQNIVAGPGSLSVVGNGTLALSGAHTYSGNTAIHQGTLQMAVGGSIAGTTNVTLSGHATCDVSVATAGLTLASAQSFTVAGFGSTGVLLTAASKGLTLGATSPLRFTAFTNGTTPLAVAGAGSLTLAAGNPVVVIISNGGNALAVGTYRLIAKGASGSVAGTAPGSVTVSGDGVAGGSAVSLVITSGELFLQVDAALASEPTVQASHPTYSAIQVAQMTASWTSGDGANRIVLARAGAAPTGAPADGTGYSADAAYGTGGTGLGDGFVVYNGSGNSFTLTSLMPGTTYHLKVFEFNGSGSTANYLTSGTPGHSSQITVPDAPNATAASGASSSSFSANWDAATGAAGYYLDAATDSGFSSLVSGFNNRDVSSVTTFSVTGLTASTTYYYRLRAYDAGGTSTNSGAISVTTAASVTEPSVATPTVSGITARGATLGATVTSDGNSALLARGTVWGTSANPTGNQLGEGGTGGSPFSHARSGMNAGTLIYFRGYATNAIGIGYSPDGSFWTVPDAPAVGAASAVGATSFDANWSSATGATNYQLDAATDAGFTSYVSGFQDRRVGNVVTYGVTGLSPNVTYYYRLRAQDAGGTSTNSAQVMTNTPAVLPTVVTAVATATNSSSATAGGDVTADGGATVTNRGVVWATTSSPTVPGAQTTNGTGTGSYSATLTNLVSGASFFYRAFAQSSVGTAYGSEYTLATPCFSGVVAGLLASATNATDFTAAWSSFADAAGYALDVSTSSTFSAAGGGNHGAEAFTNVDGGTTSSYLTRQWTNNGVAWTGFLGRIDQTIDGSEALTLQNASGAFLTSQPISGGVNELRVTHQLKFAGADAFDIFVNGVKVATNVAYSSSVQTAVVQNLNISGAFTIMITNHVGGRVALDNVTWTNSGGSAASYVSGYSNRAASATSQVVTGLVSGATYYFRARATNAACITPNSSTASVTTIAAPAPEIAILGTNLAVIADGAAVPAQADGTLFGWIDSATGLASRVFTITNSGTATLTITGVATSGAQAADFIVSVPPSATVAASAATTFTVQFDPAAPGPRSATIIVACDDADESAYDFVVAGTGTLPLAAALDTTGLAWITDGSNRVAWFGQTNVTHDGMDAAQSGSITNDGATWFSADVTGPGTVTFWWKVSSEATYDALDFFVGTNHLTSISGTAGWLQYTAAVPAGVQELYWQYVKDGSITAGSDAGWVDQVVFTPSAAAAAWSAFGLNGDGTNVTDAQFAQAITVRVTFADSDGVNWNGSSITPPDHSPYLSLTNPAGVEVLAPVSFQAAGHADGEVTAVMTGVVSVSSVTTGAGFRASFSATDQAGNTTNVSFGFAVLDDDPAPPQALSFTIDGVGGTGESNLLAGAVAIVAVNGNPSNGLERFSFVVLSPYPAGTVIDFTDCGWNPAATNWHRPVEFHTNRFVSSGDADVGQVFTLTISDLNNNGDQLAAYQYRGTNTAVTDASNVVFISAINLDAEANGWDLPAIPDNNEHSGLYFGLTNGWTAVSVPNAGANVHYTGTLVGTASALLQSIMNSNNWAVDGSPRDVAISNYAFSVTGSGILQWDVVNLLDAQVRAGGYRITNLVQDLGSGLSTGSPLFRLVASNGQVMVSNTFAVGYGNGSMAMETLTMTAGTGHYSQIFLGSAEGLISVSDVDSDRPSDAAAAVITVPVFVMDDDADPPVLTNLTMKGGSSASLGDSGDLLYYSFGTGPDSDLQPEVRSGSLAVSDLSARGSVPTTQSGGYTNGNAVSDTGWNTGTSFWQIVVSADSGYSLQLTNVHFASRCSPTGPTNWALRYSADAYATDLASGDLQTNNGYIIRQGALAGASAATGAVTLRLYGAGAATGAGTWRIDDLRFQGTVGLATGTWVATDADLAAGTLALSTYVQDTNSGVMGLGYALQPVYRLTAPAGVVAAAAAFAEGPTSNGAARGTSVRMTATVAAVSFTNIAVGVFTAAVQVVDADDDRVGDRQTTLEERALFVVDDDAAPPQLSADRGSYLRFDGVIASSELSAITDQQLVDGLSITDRIYDARSGVLSSSLQFRIRDPAGWDSGWQLFPNRPADGSARTNGYATGGALAVDNYGVDIASRALGVWTVALQAVDFDGDRAGDSASNQVAFDVYVVDDDRLGPRMTNFVSADAGLPVLLTGFETNDGWMSRAAGNWTNTAFDGVWVSTGAYVQTTSGRGGLGYNVGFNDAGDVIALPPLDRPGWVILWARLSGAGQSTFAVDRFDGSNWTNLGSQAVVSTSYQEFAWTVDATGTAVNLRLRLASQDTGSRSVYVDDLAIVPYAGWTNVAQVRLTWDAADDASTGGSGLHAYRYTALGAHAPVQATNGLGTGSRTVDVDSVEGVVTGYVFAVDDDTDRGTADRTMGTAVPHLHRIDRTSPAAITNVVAGRSETDPTADIQLTWTPLPDAGGTNLSPWRTYHVFFTEDGSAPSSNGPSLRADNGAVALGTNTTASILLSNLTFGSEVRLAMAGADRAGNIGPLSGVSTVLLERFAITQGVARADNAAEVRWRHAPGKEYDVIYADARSFSSALSNTWDLAGTIATNWLADTGGVSRVSPVDLVNSMRFYRAASKDQWRQGQARRTATMEVYAAMPLVLREGENLVSLAMIPDDRSIDSVLGTNRLPAGTTLGQGTVVSFYGASSNGQAQGASVWLSTSGWMWSTGGQANGFALPIDEGFNIKLPAGSGTRRVVVVGRVPTQEVVRILQPHAYNIEGYNIPYRTTVGGLGLREAGLRGHVSNPNLADEIRILDNSAGLGPYSSPKYRIWYRTSDQTFRTIGGNASAGGYVVEPEDAVIIYTRASTDALSWTNRIPYPLPSSALNP